MGEGGGGFNVFCVCVELGDWASEKLSWRVQLEGHSPKWQALQNFSFQPCIYIICLTYGINTFMVINTSYY